MLEYVPVGQALQVAPSLQYPGLQAHVETSVAVPGGQRVDLLAPTQHSRQVVQAAAFPPALYVPLGQVVQTPADRNTPGAHVVGTHAAPSRVAPSPHAHVQLDTDEPELT